MVIRTLKVLLLLFILGAFPQLFAGDDPQLTGIVPAEGGPGDEITLSGVDLPTTAEDFDVTFVSTDGSVAIPGVIVEVADSGTDVEIVVVVPNGVRTGVIELRERDGDETVLIECGDAGCNEFTAYPVVVGVVVGLEGDRGVVLSFGDFYLPGNVEFYGYNFDTVDGCVVSDKVFAEDDSPDVSAFTPDDYDLPEGTTAVSVEIPEPYDELYPPGYICPDGGSAPFAFELSATMPSGGTVTLPAIDVQLISNFGGIALADIAPATVSSVLVPSGIRRGRLEIEYQLMEAGSEGAQTRWDLVPQFRDPSVDDDDDPDAWKDCATVDREWRDGELVVPGVPVHPSGIGAIVSSGATNSFVWDTQATEDDGGLPEGIHTTRLRLLPTNPDESSGDIGECENGVWETGPIVVDNRDDETLQWIEEHFTSLASFASGDAEWDVDAGTISGTTDGIPVYGTGTESIVLESGETYEFDTDTGSAQQTSGTPSDLFSDNPGALLETPEFWVSSLVLEAGATLEVIGSNPLVIRASGTGDPDVAAVLIEGDISLDGGDGEEGTDDEPGSGGAGAPGGGRGGDGGHVSTNGFNAPGAVEQLVLAQHGSNHGGRAARDISLLQPYPNLSNPRGGSGGGGGHAESGRDGVVSGDSSVIRSEPGRGGPSRGTEELIVLTGGAGGGGGAGVCIRTDDDPTVGIEGRGAGGGGGGGGALRIVADGAIEIEGAITVNGGVGETGPDTGSAGAGGGGSGGAILLQASTDLTIDDGALLLALGGAGGRVSDDQYGGDGAPGRIRLEANGDLTVPGSPDCESLVVGGTSAEPPNSGICPEPSTGDFDQAATIVSSAQLEPIPMSVHGVLGEVVASSADLTFDDQPDGTDAMVLFEGAHESSDTAGTPGDFFGFVMDPTELGFVDYVRATVLLYSNLETEEVPVLSAMEFPVALDTIEFQRGDVDSNGTVSALLDALFLMNFGFNSGEEPECLRAADVDGNDALSVLVDSLYLLTWQFTQGTPPPNPGPFECGPNASELDCDATSDECT